MWNSTRRADAHWSAATCSRCGCATAQATQDLDEINQRTTAALQQKKDKTLDKIEEYNAKVAADQAVREITDAEIDDFVETLDELDSTEDVSKINQEKIKNFLNSNSVSAIYSKLIEKFGTAIIYKLINAVVAVGNNSKIDALASIIKSGSLMEELFAKCQNKRLLDKLQPSTVKRFIPYMNDLSAFYFCFPVLQAFSYCRNSGLRYMEIVIHNISTWLIMQWFPRF